MPARSLLALLGGFCAATAGRGAVPPKEPADLSLTQIEITDAELDGVRHGAIFVKVLPEKAKKTISVQGVMRVKVPLDFVLRQIEDIEAYKRGPAVLQVRKFQRTPEEQDLRSLQLLPSDIAALPDCRPMACTVKLSADMMKQIQSQPGGRNGASAQNAERAFQHVLFQYFKHYLERGRDALITYQDKPQASSLAEASAGVLQEVGWIRPYAPALWSLLEHQDPLDRNPTSRGDFYYWSKEKAGLKAVVSLTQVTTWRSMVERPSTALIASKQLYASHYFEASLGLTVLIDDTTAEGPAVWIAYFNSSSVDAFDGFLGGLKRSLAVLRLPGALRGNLVQTKRNIESGYTAAREPRLPNQLSSEGVSK